jgi:hypothetical protein
MANKENMSGLLGEEYWWVETEVFKGQLFQYHFDHHKSHPEWPVISNSE